MSQWKCNACGGTYSDTLKDGTIYFHACAPLAPDAQGVQAERANKRNENISMDRFGRGHDILAPGAGVTPMQGQPTAEPPWIVDLRAKAAALPAVVP